jgi:hypothetical protein
LHRLAVAEDDVPISFESSFAAACAHRAESSLSTDTSSSCSGRKRSLPIRYLATNWRDYALVESVDASAKLDEICGYHQGWCNRPEMLFSN